MTDGASASAEADVVLRLTNLTKSFAGTLALDSVDLDVRKGEILALLGGNGSGKSTTIKILAGLQTPDAGTIQIGNSGVVHDATAWTVGKANSANLHFVHQHLGLFPDMSVAENIALGRGFRVRPTGIDWADARRRAEAALTRFEIATIPEAVVGALSQAGQTMIAIARALQDQETDSDAILFLDEPTASLPGHEVAILHAALRRYAAAGQTIVYVSHRLDEVLALADRVTVLRDGRKAATERARELDKRRLIELIAGSAPDPVRQQSGRTPSREPALRIRGLCGGPLAGVDFDVSRGEVLGIAGLLGSGRTEILRAIFGAHRASGEIVLNGKAAAYSKPAKAMAGGIGYVPEDRAADAVFADMSVGENVSAAVIKSFWNGMTLRRRRERREARDVVDRFSIKAPDIDVPMATLSGGNQQKAVVARWLRRKPQLLLLDEPTQGVDVGARSQIHAMVRAAARDGASVVVVSSDFEELASMCDRVVVLRNGRIADECREPQLTSHRLTELIYMTKEDSA
jgi:ribose transport system ATP-binding protein